MLSSWRTGGVDPSADLLAVFTERRMGVGAYL